MDETEKKLALIAQIVALRPHDGFLLEGTNASGLVWSKPDTPPFSDEELALIDVD
jgi:hypothetical protein